MPRLSQLVPLVMPMGDQLSKSFKFKEKLN